MKKKNILTPSEKILMDVFWEHQEPLTSVELTQLCSNHDWNQEYILNMLHKIQKKGFLEVCGTVKYRIKNARSFRPTITKEEYAAQLALSVGIDVSSFAETALAMVAHLGNKEDIINELEQLIQELKEKENVR